MLRRFTPAVASGSAIFTNCEPLLVITSSRSPGSALIRAHKSTMPRLTSGSPPVKRILRTPRETNRRASRSISSRERICARGKKVMSSAMQ